ncbi:MAG: insulinase family protein [Nitrospirae bacterium]|nr:insulinase family protein [Nitrospirota bacterium]
MFKKAHLDNGMPLVMKQLKNMHSVSLGVWVKVGSRNEPPHKNGISHFLEHMFFKGTKKRSSRDISVDVDYMGGDLNAFTSKESTTFYIKVLDEYLDKGISLLSDIFLHSTFPEEEIEKEKGVIKEEIKMVEDTPEDYVHDLFSQAVWGNVGIGQPILGRTDTIKTITREDLINYIKKFYGTKDTLLACAGNFEPERLVDTLNRRFGTLRQGSEPDTGGYPEFHAGQNIHSKDCSEVHICLAAEGIPQASPERYCLSALNAILGAGVSSILFQEIREKRGLVYSIHSFLASYFDTGLWGVYAGCSRKNVNEVLDLILREFKGLPESVGYSELERAKKQLRGNLILGLESTSAMMHNIARQEIYYGRYYSLEELIKEIDSLTLSSLKGLSERLIKGKGITLTILGPVDKDSIQVQL